MLSRSIDNNGLTNVVGVVFLLLIAVGLFSVLYFFVLTIEPVYDEPCVDIIVYGGDDGITLFHFGGVPLKYSSLVFYVDGEQVTLDYHGDDYWEFGERLQYQPSTTGSYHVSIVDMVSNSMITDSKVTVY